MNRDDEVRAEVERLRAALVAVLDGDQGHCCGYDAFGCGTNCRYCGKVKRNFLGNPANHAPDCPYRLGREMLAGEAMGKS